jgi:hypothetical protein
VATLDTDTPCLRPMDWRVRSSSWKRSQPPQLWIMA